jgi:hypothetical protein
VKKVSVSYVKSRLEVAAGVMIIIFLVSRPESSLAHGECCILVTIQKIIQRPQRGRFGQAKPVRAPAW